MLYEAAAIQEARILDSDDVRVFGGKSLKTKERRIKVVNIDIGGGVDAEGFQLAIDPKQFKKKLRWTILQELSKKDVMSDARAQTVSCLLMQLLILLLGQLTKQTNGYFYIGFP